jgi:16S rRNA (cytosine1402-N4)-methyltransferase
MAAKIVRGIVAERSRGPITSTRQLARIVAGAKGGARGKIDPATRVFQALRIEVNDEFGALDALLRQLPGCLRPGGRVAFLTFHSGEDRRVKKAFDQGARIGLFAGVSREVVRASGPERRANARSRAAKLRSARLVG